MVNQTYLKIDKSKSHKTNNTLLVSMPHFTGSLNPLNHMFKSCLIIVFGYLAILVNIRTDEVVFSRQMFVDNWNKEKYQTLNRIFFPNWPFFQREKSILIIRLSSANWVSHFIQWNDRSLMVTEIDYRYRFVGHCSPWKKKQSLAHTQENEKWYSYTANQQNSCCRIHAIDTVKQGGGNFDKNPRIHSRKDSCQQSWENLNWSSQKCKTHKKMEGNP